MIAVIPNNQWIYLDNITQAEDDILWNAFSVVRPGIYVDPSQRGNWDGIYRKYNRGQQRLARPLLSMLRGVCKKHNLPLIVRDERKPWPYTVVDPNNINADFLPGITLEQFQVDCIRRGTKVECGIVNVPTGGGKGELIAGFCKAISCPTIVLADQKIVIDQLKARLELRDVAEKVGLFYAGKRPNGEAIVVGSIQSLTAPSKTPDIPDRLPDETDAHFDARMKKWEQKFKAYKTRRANVRTLQRYVKTAQMIIVDECDKAVSDPWKNVFRHHFKGRRRYGFSGTPFDPDKPVEEMVVQEHLGSVIFQESREHLEGLGRIIPCEYYSLAFGLDGDIHEASAYDIAYNEHITENPTFHSMVARLCRKCKRESDHGTLILVDREALGKRLEAAVNATGLKCHYIYGKTTPKKRNEVLKMFERREIDVLIGGKIINRGLDLKGGCENLIIACGGKLQSDFEQKIGRAVRVNKLGKSRVYDFFFRCNRYLYDHSKARLKKMIKLNYRTSVVFPGGSISGQDFVKSQFRIKKALLVAPPRLFTTPAIP